MYNDRRYDLKIHVSIFVAEIVQFFVEFLHRLLVIRSEEDVSCVLLSTLQIGATLGWFVIVDTRPTQADISRKIL